MASDLRNKIIQINDWPNPGIVCFDITPLLTDPKDFEVIIEALAKPYLGEKVDVVAGIEARGFVLAGALARRLDAGIVMIRKRGKLPRETIAQDYSYEYAANVIEINTDVIKSGQRVVLVDDILATGGTMAAAVKLVNRLSGKIIGISFVVKMDFMAGEERIKGQKIYSLVNYE